MFFNSRSFLIALIRACYYEFIFLFASFCGLFIPSKQNQWLFCINSKFTFEGNIRAVHDKATEIDGVQSVILCPNKKFVNEMTSIYGGANYNNVRIVSKNSFLAVCCYIRSKVCFVSHSHSDIYSRFFFHWRKVVIDVHHGVPIKAVFFAEEIDRNLRKNRKLLNRFHCKVSYVIANSEIDKLSMSSSMQHNPHAVWVTGLPRNDFLFRNAAISKDLFEQEKQLKRIIGDKKFVLYAPTWRRLEFSGIFSKGDVGDNPFGDGDDFDRLVKILENHGVILGIRRHYCSGLWGYRKHPNIIECDQRNFLETQILLRNTDILITDYSGIWVDFLLLNRPILGFCYDYEEYMKDRSFLYNFKKVFPGKIAYDIESLIDSLQDLLLKGDTDQDKLLRERSFDIFHKYSDGNNSQRVIDKVMELAR